ncbi:MAG: UbiD family decarboxylase [Rickettsia endosymbiont of Ixodes persulcatus]|nr:UbiD family decarboxylase [Rickettsia endosymbiont of Ixodes persulcatus]MCZ6903407.1 UbiD family decarboxylase [Rickettsia endosymbiont of Ixodes persulcatus]MCZ6909219.1 UbiD family decarboxylase [Rickettsia endosymbiont of Ixodes persulcatus]MCZ6909849.1 UbiD family decarboxylase [Rickettsia endosymbiont of Ixodes persulcatus]MCZ6914722.1 UbiD family decarboxylase [Rickettsia endosymbiont of Ixodes persulcatus]
MSFKDLLEFLKFLEKNGELKRISTEVKTDLEITEISRRVLAQGGPALLFENVIKADGTKSDIPVLTNLYARIKRICMGLKLQNVEELRELGVLLAFLKQPQPPASFKETLSMLPLAKRIFAMSPKTISKAACHEVIIDKPNINILPIQKCWPDDISPLITWGIVVTKGPTKDKIRPPSKFAYREKFKGDTKRSTAAYMDIREDVSIGSMYKLPLEVEFGKRSIDNYNLGIYRMQVISENKLLMRWLKLRGGAEHHKHWREAKKEPFPAAIIIGANPAVTLAAVTPIPENISEYNFAGLLGNEKVELVQCKTIDLKVPAHSEIVLEGYVSLEEYLPEGPFGDHTGYYNDVEEFPVFIVTAITMKKNPVYLSTYTGKPPDEPSILGEALNEIFIPILQQQFPEIVDFWLPPEGCSYRIAVVSIKKSYPGHAKRIMLGIWSYLRQFMYSKFIIVVDDDIDVRNWQEVIWAIATRSDPRRDTTFIDNSPIDYLDFASPQSGLGSKMGIDATDKIYAETNRKWGKKIEMSQEVINKIDNMWDGLKI